MNLKQIYPPALYQLLGYLGAVGDFIRTGELNWYFDIKLSEYKDTAPDIRDFIGTAFPGSKPSLAEITEVSLQDLAVPRKRGSYGSASVMCAAPVTR